MSGRDVILLHLKETRDRAMMVFEAIPEEYALWKPDADSMSLAHTVRHFFECDDWNVKVIQHGVDAESVMPDWDSMPFSTIRHEIAYGLPYREKFMELAASYTDEDLSNIMVTRPKWQKNMGDFLTRCAYHDAYHTGQLQYFLRMLNVPRPNVWL